MRTVRITSTGTVSADVEELFESVHQTAAITRTLPTATMVQDGHGTRRVARTVHICDCDGRADIYPITVTPGAGETISGGGSYSITTPYQTVTFRRDGAGQWVVFDGQTASDTATDYGVRVSKFMSLEQLADGKAGTGSIDCTAAIQAAIDFAIYRNLANGPGGPEIVLPDGCYTYSDTLHVAYGTDFRSATLRGQGPRVGSSLGVKGSGTLLKFTKSDRPGISVQGGRGITIKNLRLQGMNFDHVNDITSNPTVSNLDASNWVDPDLSASAGSRYTPYAGIAIDPYSGERPEISYPDVVYPAFLGSVSQYGKNFSTRVWIDNVVIDGFVVPVAIQPCDADGNGDFTKMTRCEFSRCQYGVSIGNSQSRVTSFENGEIHKCHTPFVTGKHGRQTGKPDIVVSSVGIHDCVQLLDIPTTGYGGGVDLRDVYCESIYAIGSVGSSSVFQYSTSFKHCSFNFTSWSTYGVPTYVFRNDGHGFTTFEASSFAGPTDGRFAMFGLTKASGFRFISSQLDTTKQTEQHERMALNATAGLHFNQASTDLSDFSFRVPAHYNLDTGVSAGATIHNGLSSGSRARLLPVYCHTARANINDPGFGMPHPEYSLGKSAMSFSVTGRDVTVDLGESHTEARFARMGGDVGDVVWDSETGVTFYVKSRTGTEITMRAQTGFYVDEELLLPITTAGSLYLLNCRRYTPQYVTYCATSSSSASATGVQRDDGFKAYIDSEMPADDWFWVDPEVDHYLPSASAKIASVDASAGTLTASGNFRRTETRVRLKLFVRAAAPNAD